jgi:predicted RNA binding protein YcfA (HicA-like mRNA interferase family)
MKLPRDVSGAELVKSLKLFGYEVTRQRGSHIRVTTRRNGEHHVTVPNHTELRVGTLSDILTAVSEHLEMTKDQVAAALFRQVN